MNYFPKSLRQTLRLVMENPKTRRRMLAKKSTIGQGTLHWCLNYLTSHGYIVPSGHGWRSVCFGEPIYLDDDALIAKPEPNIEPPPKPYVSLASRIKAIARRRTA